MSREAAARFLVHQVVGTVGVVVLSAMSWYATLELLKLARVSLTAETASLILLGIPGFPFQSASGFALGFGLSRRVRATSVVFIWILPLLWFLFGAFSVAATWNLAYLVGGKRNATEGCFYQVTFTLPFVASVSYTLGAVVSLWVMRRPSVHRDHLAGSENI